MTYLILANPGHNRVYFEESKKLAAAELELALGALSVPCRAPEGIILAGVYYLRFEADEGLSEADIAVLSRLSFTYAIFKLAECEETALLPVKASDYCYIGEDISTILKYTGKTNELFTRFLINTALFASGVSDPSGLKLLDPVAGKGTTLFEGLILGMDIYGVEIGERPVDEACQHLQKYLQLGKYKYSAKTERVSGENRSFRAQRHSFELARDRESAKRGDFRHFELVSGNSRYINKLFKKNFFDIIVGDLPYGVRHGSVTGEGQSALNRSPSALLSACLPAWRETLKSGGTLALAYNTFTLPRQEAEALLSTAGFTVLTGGVYDYLAHKVDQSIIREVIVAKKA